MPAKTYTREEAIGLLRSELPEEDAYSVGDRYIDLLISEGHIPPELEIPAKNINYLIKKVNGSIVASRIRNSYEKPGRIDVIMRSEDIQEFYVVIAGVRRIPNKNVDAFKKAVHAAYMEEEERLGKKLRQKEEAMKTERDECLDIVGESHRLLVEDLESIPLPNGLEAARKYRSMFLKALSSVKKKVYMIMRLKISEE